MNKKMQGVLWVVVAVIVLWLGYSLLPSNAPISQDAVQPKEPIKIGFIGPLTGDAASIGQNAKVAVEIAVDEVNKAGGINGSELQVVYEDGQCTGKVASAAANKLINADNVPIILGGLCSGETASFASAAEEAKRVVLSYCSSAPTITQAGDYIFRDYPSDLYQGAFGAEYIFNTLGKKKVAVMYVKNDWGAGIKGVFEENFKRLGGQIVVEEGYDQTARDLRTQLTKVKAAKPDLVYFLGYTEGSIVGLKQAKDLKLNIPFFGADGWDDQKIFDGAGAAAEGIMYSVVSAPLNNAFKASMKAKLGSDEVTICSPQAYDGVKLLAQAMKKVGADPTAVKDELYKMEYSGGVSAATIKFDSNGDLVGANYVVKVVNNGKAEEVK
ncbi:MAG: ABC transporter substrate-binding protein [Patescibacteria group bacterium]